MYFTFYIVQIFLGMFFSHILVKSVIIFVGRKFRRTSSFINFYYEILCLFTPDSFFLFLKVVFQNLPILTFLSIVGLLLWLVFQKFLKKMEDAEEAVKPSFYNYI